MKQLHLDNAQLLAENVQLRLENTQLKEKLKALESRLDKNSQNSHLAPSKDPHRIKSAFPRVQGGKIGGKEGHKGRTLDKVEIVDEIETISPHKCTCGMSLMNIKGEVIETRQVFDLPPIQLHVKEYQLVECICPKCHQANRGEFPTQVKAPTQYGEQIKALCVLLSVDYKIPYQKTYQLMKDLAGITINESTLIQANKKCYNLLEKTEEQIKQNLNASPLVNGDETGINILADLYWMHIVCNTKFTYQYPHKKRGIEAMEDDRSILKDYSGIVVHDCWSSYFKLKFAKHAICGAHLIRELNALVEEGSKWANKFTDFFINTYKNPIDKNEREKKNILTRYDNILRQGIKEEPPPKRTGKRGRLKKSKGLNLIERLKEHKCSVMSFAFDKNIPFTNNQAERDLRHCKTKLKIAGCFRSFQGAEQYARISSFSSTLRKNSINVLDSLRSLFQNGHFELNLT